MSNKIDDQNNLLQEKVIEFIKLPRTNNKRQEIIDFLLGEFQSLLIDKFMSETFFDKDKSKIVKVNFGLNYFKVTTENGVMQLLNVKQIYNLAVNGGFEEDNLRLYLLK